MNRHQKWYLGPIKSVQLPVWRTFAPGSSEPSVSRVNRCIHNPSLELFFNPSIFPLGRPIFSFTTREYNCRSESPPFRSRSRLIKRVSVRLWILLPMSEHRTRIIQPASVSLPTGDLPYLSLRQLICIAGWPSLLGAKHKAIIISTRRLSSLWLSHAHL